MQFALCKCKLAAEFKSCNDGKNWYSSQRWAVACSNGEMKFFSEVAQNRGSHIVVLESLLILWTSLSHIHWFSFYAVSPYFKILLNCTQRWLNAFSTFIISAYSLGHRHATSLLTGVIIHIIEIKKEAVLPDVLWKVFLLKRVTNLIQHLPCMRKPSKVVVYVLFMNRGKIRIS